MQLSELGIAGIDEWLVEQLRSWGIETLTEIQERALAAGIADGRSNLLTLLSQSDCKESR